MKSPIAKYTIIAVATLIFPLVAMAQGAIYNPGEITLVQSHSETMNKQFNREMSAEKKTIAYQNVLSAYELKIANWQRQYNEYLMDVNRYASTLKASSTIVSDALSIFNELIAIKDAVSANPQGMVATAALNNLYGQVAADFVTVFNVFNNSIAKGGETNMLTGAERSKSLWMIEDTLKQLYKDLRKLCISLKFHNMMDVWNNALMGYGVLDKKSIAEIAHDRWKRAARASMTSSR